MRGGVQYHIDRFPHEVRTETRMDALQNWSPAALSELARPLYSDGSLLLRVLNRYRPYVCPFHELMKYVPQGADVLDVGCGGGLALALLGAAGIIRSGIGFDTSVQAIDVATRMAGKVPGVPLDFRRLDVGDPWPEGLFDCVLLVDVLHHVPVGAQKSVIEMAAAKVRPGGRLIYKDMAGDAGWRSWANRLHDLTLARQWIHYLPVENAVEWATRAGLTPEHSEDFTMLCYRHELRVFRRGMPARADT